MRKIKGKPILNAIWLVFSVAGLGAVPVFAQVAAGADFSYSGDKGPGFWQDLAKDYSACADTPSSRQSPVDITGAVENPALRPLDLMFGETSFMVKNTGYTVQGVPADGGMLSGILIMDGRAFTFKQFHFHSLSEHVLQGRHDALELHAVFEDGSANYAVIGVLFRTGARNAFLERLIAAGLPQRSAAPAVAVSSLNLRESLTSTASYYTYPGSLTTPPCKETVTWLVLQQEAQASNEQLEEFRKVLGNDFRPLQQIHKRTIYVTPKR